MVNVLALQWNFSKLFKMKPLFHWLQELHWFMYQTSLSTDNKIRKFKFLPTSKPKSHYFPVAFSCWLQLLLNQTNKTKIKRPKYLRKEKVKFDKDFNWLGKAFDIINLKNSGAITILWFSTLVKKSFGNIYEKFAMCYLTLSRTIHKVPVMVIVEDLWFVMES